MKMNMIIGKKQLVLACLIDSRQLLFHNRTSPFRTCFHPPLFREWGFQKPTISSYFPVFQALYHNAAGFESSFSPAEARQKNAAGRKAGGARRTCIIGS